MRFGIPTRTTGRWFSPVEKPTLACKIQTVIIVSTCLKKLQNIWKKGKKMSFSQFLWDSFVFLKSVLRFYRIFQTSDKIMWSFFLPFVNCFAIWRSWITWTNIQKSRQTPDGQTGNLAGPLSPKSPTKFSFCLSTFHLHTNCK